MSPRFRRIAGSSTAHMAVAFLAMGGWAVLVDRGHPMPRPLVAGAVQGTLSASITLLLKRCIEGLARRLSGKAALWAPPLAAIVVSATLLLIIHVLSGTPEIAGTVALPLFVSSSYAAALSLSLRRSREQRRP